MLSTANTPRILSQTPGRMRVHLAGWTEEELARIEPWLRQLPAVESVQANRLTGNVLIRFDPQRIETAALLAMLQQPPEPELVPQEEPELVSSSTLLKVGMRGVLGHAMVDALWFGAGYLGKRMGLPLAGLGPLHVLLDFVVWGAALTSAKGGQPGPLYRLALANAKR